MGAGDRAYMKDVCRLALSIDKLTCGQVRLDLGCDEDRTFYLYVTPDDGYYKGATCKFKVSVPTTYPAKAPYVTCMNRIYHPNIDIDTPESSLCVNLLEGDWRPEVGLDGCVLAVLYLFHNPNHEDALSPVFDGCSMDEVEFQENLKVSLRGGIVEGIKFDQLIHDPEQDILINIRIGENTNTQNDEVITNSNGRLNMKQTGELT